MVVLLVIGTLALLLAAACMWEARTSRPEWGSSRDPAVRNAANRNAGVSWRVGGGGGGGGDGS
jgi:hypothetical protein